MRHGTVIVSLAIVYSRASYGITSPLVTVEVHLSNGLPSFTVVGLAETAVKESRERVRSALKNSGFEFPTRRITVGLAPADLPKRGGRFDLPIAVGILVAAGQLSADVLRGVEYCAELGLGGELRQVDGILPAVVAATTAGRTIVLAPHNLAEAGLVRSANLLAAPDLTAMVDHLTGVHVIEHTAAPPVVESPSRVSLVEVRGQPVARRAIEVAAAGGHGLAMVGPPGCGKSMLATRLPALLPKMSDAQGLETAMVYSLAGKTRPPSALLTRPFRAPHHSITAAALIGGGRLPRPGEISLAHNGVLFLDELTEFSRSVLEQLREPLESGAIMVARDNHSLHFPCRFQLIAAMNPCPCGYYGDMGNECRCSTAQLQRYRSKVSGPMLDRIDLQVQVSPVSATDLVRRDTTDGDGRCIVQRVAVAQEIQSARNECANADLTPEAIAKVCVLDSGAKELLEKGISVLGLSARAYHSVLRVSRTLADLANDETVKAEQLAEALSYRTIDRYSNTSSSF